MNKGYFTPVFVDTFFAFYYKLNSCKRERTFRVIFTFIVDVSNTFKEVQLSLAEGPSTDLRLTSRLTKNLFFLPENKIKNLLNKFAGEKNLN